MMHKILLTLLVFGLFLTTAVAQTQDKVDFVKGNISLEIEPQGKRILGTVTYEFDVLNPIDSVFLDAKDMTFKSVLLNSKKVKFTTDKDHITIHKKFKKGEKHLLTLNYSTSPKQTVYFIGWQDSIADKKQIWTQGQGKYTSHWLPSFDDMTEKVEFDMSITFDKNYQVIANGTLIQSEKLKTNLRYARTHE